MRGDPCITPLAKALEGIPGGEEAQALLVLLPLGDAPLPKTITASLDALAKAHGDSLPKEAFPTLLDHAWDCAPLMRKLAARKEAPPEVLDRLAQHPEPTVRALVAFHPKAHPETLTVLYRDPTVPWWVLRGLVRNPNTPREVLEAIARAKWGREITERARVRLDATPGGNP
ncbi:hypothetical protein [Thermus caldilimi]|uniref:hypothetical protein n=1 Tax=Thermus caldilimi TaxID=2483360 RepID=UPI0010761A6E|nr:hypothetical protein [Thermus caldilimi]